jgi:hypothetical protein
MPTLVMRSCCRSRIQDERDAIQIASGSRETSETRLDRIVHGDRDASRGLLSGGRHVSAERDDEVALLAH